VKWLDNKINSFYNQLGFGTLGKGSAGFDSDYFSFIPLPDLEMTAI